MKLYKITSVVEVFLLILITFMDNGCIRIVLALAAFMLMIACLRLLEKNK